MVLYITGLCFRQRIRYVSPMPAAPAYYHVKRLYVHLNIYCATGPTNLVFAIQMTSCELCYYVYICIYKLYDACLCMLNGQSQLYEDLRVTDMCYHSLRHTTQVNIILTLALLDLLTNYYKLHYYRIISTSTISPIIHYILYL